MMKSSGLEANKKLKGVSIVMCCHNSASRLTKTLAHLNRQKVGDDVSWEVVIVDNASADNTAEIARDCWPSKSTAPLRVIHEPRLGLSFARHRGLHEAKYEIVSFIDDDNWVCPEWVQLASDILSSHPEVGACGGYVEAACEAEPPQWFEKYKIYYAVGPQGEDGDITLTRGALWGAGLTIRKSAWQGLVNNGFHSLLVDRQGTALSTGGDLELCYALRLRGWRLWYDSRLHMQHFIPASRLDFDYFRRLYRANGAALVNYEPYDLATKSNPRTFKGRLKETWQGRLLVHLRLMARMRNKWFLVRGDKTDSVLEREKLLGSLLEILRKRKSYNLEVKDVRQARWKQSTQF